MANENEKNCGPCYYRHETVPAIKWCTDCSEALCESCFDHHTSLKITRNHHVIPVADFHDIASVVDLSEMINCEDHGKRLGFFCPSHDEVLCITCIQTAHTQCAGWAPVEETAKDVKSSVAMADLQHDLKETIGNVEEIIENQRTQRAANDTQKQELKNNTEQIRQQIIEKIKQLESAFLSKIDLEYQQADESIDVKITKFENKLAILKKIHDTTEKLKIHASDINTFVYIRKAVKQLHKELDILHKISDENKEVKINVRINKRISSILPDLQSFGDVSAISATIPLKWTTSRKTEQIEIDRTGELPFDHIKIHSTIQVDIKGSTSASIWSCAVLPNKILAFNGRERRKVTLHRYDGTFCGELICGSKVKYITVIDEHRLAMSCTDNRVIVYNKQLSKIDKTLMVNDQCYGIAYDNHKLFVVGDENLHCFYLSGKLVYTIPVDTNFVSFVCIHEENLYFADFQLDVVYCYDQQGYEIWQFTSHLIKKPLGITTDAYGHVYVACETSNNVVIISADGKQCKEILTGKDGLHGPRCLCYDKKENQLLVVASQYDNKAFLCAFA